MTGLDSIIGIGFENYKIFKKRIWFNLDRLTILTGPNNSGKSSVINSIVMLAKNALKPDGLDTLKFNKRSAKNKDFNECLSKNSNNKYLKFITGIFNTVYKPYHQTRQNATTLLSS